MAGVRKNKKVGALRKSHRGKTRKIRIRRQKVAAKSKRKCYVIKFPRSGCFTACPLVRWYFSQKMQDNHFSLRKGKHPTGRGPLHQKTSTHVGTRKRPTRVDIRKRSVRVHNWKKSMRADNRKKSGQADHRKTFVRACKAKKAHHTTCTCPNVMHATLREVANKKQVKWVVTGTNRRNLFSNKESFYKPAAREEGEGSSSSFDLGAQVLGGNASGMIPLPTATEFKEVSS